MLVALTVLAGCQLTDRSDGHRVRQVMVVGDSLMFNAAGAMARSYGRFDVPVRYVGFPATGPLWNDREWFAMVADALAAVQPDVVIFESCCVYPGAAFPTLGGGQLYVNDDGLTVEPDSELMFTEWERAARQLISMAEGAGATAWWVTLPPATEASRFYGEQFPERIARLTAMYRTLGVPIVDWGVPAAEDPGIRHPDGVHFTDAGQQVVADHTVNTTTRLVLDG